MHREVLVRARWRLAEVKAFEDEHQLIPEGAISAFYPMALCRPMLGRSPRTGATEKDHCLAEERGEAFCLFPALDRAIGRGGLSG